MIEMLPEDEKAYKKERLSPKIREPGKLFPRHPVCQMQLDISLILAFVFVTTLARRIILSSVFSDGLIAVLLVGVVGGVVVVAICYEASYSHLKREVASLKHKAHAAGKEEADPRAIAPK